jgi:cell division transport system ATP-binding protein
MTEAPIIRFDGVSFGSPDGRRVIAGLSLTVAPGSFLFLTGPTRAGKSVLLDLISLAAVPSRGRIDVLGQDTDDLDRDERAMLRRRIGVMHQDLRLLNDYSAFDNVALPARVSRRTTPDYREQVAEVLTWVGLGGRMDAFPSQLGPADRRRLAIAQAVINGPDILLADEPTDQLEGAARFAILRLLADLNRAGVTVLIATRDTALAEGSGAPVIRLGADPSQAGATLESEPVEF